MIIESNAYRRNLKSNEIIKRQLVRVRCDKCSTEWSTLYAYRKRKVYSEDLCRTCRTSLSYSRQIPFGLRRKKCKNIKCIQCHTNLVVCPSQKKRKFCSIACRDRFGYEKKYKHLHRVFESKPDETSYLFGLILGDGNFRESGYGHTRVNIAFDAKDPKSMDTAEKVLNELKISFFKEPSSNGNCKHWGFVLPDSLLQKYKMYWHGDKFNAQPFPTSNVVENPNFAAGFLNSDGCCGWHKSYERLTANNITESIIKAFKQCLTYNRIHFTENTVPPKLDKRTGNYNRLAYTVGIFRKQHILALRNICKYRIKTGL
jgi:hypothetical protein